MNIGFQTTYSMVIINRRKKSLFIGPVTYYVYLENNRIRLMLTTTAFLSIIILWIRSVTKLKRTEDRGPWTDSVLFENRTEDRGPRSFFDKDRGPRTAVQIKGPMPNYDMGKPFGKIFF